MKITIRPPIEIDVDGDKCGEDCIHHYWQGLGHYTCLYFHLIVDDNIGRCQACLDAEKEATNATLVN